ncbi:predicted protein [Arabidopsis lyrata subsp. lyrata]|uniref:Predicted protein n=1 Tax=Arabidopsis lyrata subsp. lyrata TaxID=81972 RepID=D7LW94_ARALL|nr:predicted protein [Arabidopsis lyrata subsp. lyrata]
MEDNYRLSPKGFESRTLVKLKIDCGIDVSWMAGSIFLPMLKTLVLDSVSFYVDKFETLLHALPALDDLVLVDVNWLDSNVTISNASLKTLTIDSDGHLGTFSFDTPSLVYFFYSDYAAEDYPVVKMENLREARIFLMVSDEEIERVRVPNNDLFEDDMDNVVLRFEHVGKLMNGIRNVEYLDLSADTLEEMEIYADEDGPTNLEAPGMFEQIAHLFTLYDQVYTCDVQFMSHTIERTEHFGAKYLQMTMIPSTNNPTNLTSET